MYSHSFPYIFHSNKYGPKLLSFIRDEAMSELIILSSQIFSTNQLIQLTKPGNLSVFVHLLYGYRRLKYSASIIWITVKMILHPSSFKDWLSID